MELFKKFQTLEQKIIVRKNKLFNGFPVEIIKGVTYNQFYELIAWHNADNITKDGSNYVEKVDDLSGNGHHLIQTTQINKPLWVDTQANGHPVLRFDGSNDFMLSTFNVAQYMPITTFVVWEKNVGNLQTVFSNNGENNFALYYYLNTIDMWNSSPSYTKADGFSHLLTTSEWVGTGSKIYENGVLQATSVASPRASIFNGLNLGRFGTSYFLNGEIAEIMIAKGILSTERKQVYESYLLDKYNL